MFLILTPAELKPEMVLGFAVTDGPLTLLPANRSLLPGDIVALQQRVPDSRICIKDPALANLNAPRDARPNPEVQARVEGLAVKAAELVWDGDMSRPDSAKAPIAAIKQLVQYLERNPLAHLLPLGIKNPEEGGPEAYLKSHAAGTLVIALALGMHCRDWLARERRRGSSTRSMPDHMAEDLLPLGLGVLMMDLGMRDQPPLDHDGPLTRAQRQELTNHPEASAARIPAGLPAAVRTIVLGHHEDVSGTGYPKRASGHRIHPLCRIARVADTLDAACRDRPGRPAVSRARIGWDLMAGPDSGAYEADVVAAAMDLMPPIPVGSLIQLQDEVAAVVVASTRDVFRPVVMSLADLRGGKSMEAAAIDLTQPRAPRITSIGGESVDFLYPRKGRGAA